MKCKQCGALLASGANFCDDCGAPANGPSGASEGAAPQPSRAAPKPATGAAGSASPAGDDLDGLRTVATPGLGGKAGGEALAPGTLFDRRYDIEAVLGRGGMGIVYKAKDTVTGDPVCLKLVHPELVASEDYAQRFLREGKLTRSLRHPNIVSVFDVNNSDGSLYLSMECIEGQSLRAWLTQNLRERRTVPLGVGLHLVTQIGAGLAAAHAEQVVHRDLKPENVMLIGDPFDTATPCRVKVLDFGIARALASREHLTVAGASLGTPAYMAPEQETSADAVGPEADVYSLGAVMYEVLLNVAPRGRFELPSAVRPDLPKALDALLERALSAHPSRRPATAAAFVQELGKIQGGGGGGGAFAGGLGGGAEWMQKLGALGKETLANSGPKRWPRTLTQWMIPAWIPGLACSGWLTLWLRTKQPRFLVFAGLHAVTLLCILALPSMAEAAGMGGAPVYDAWGNFIGVEGDGGAEETAGGLLGLGFIGWIVGIVHARRARPMVATLIAEQAR